MEYRIEKDSMGEIEVEADKYWGAQTERSRRNFKIGNEKMPLDVIHALGAIKLAASCVNCEMDESERMTLEKSIYVDVAAREVMNGELDEHFPLSVWQTGSGTQTNMNVNEVIANRANKLAGGGFVHPNDDVNMSQSSNDVFPAAMHIAATLAIKNKLLPAVERLAETFRKLEAENRGVVKTGRTHLQDATPISFSGEISGWRISLKRAADMISASLGPLSYLAIGGTAVGSGLNAPRGFDKAMAKELSEITGTKFRADPNKYHALSSKSELCTAHGAIRALACDLIKIANDVRWLASGPRCGLGEITIPENEPGSSIMPGKVNPTQCEALTMVAARVIGNDATIGFAASQGNFELNVYMPVIIYSFLNSVELLSDAINSFNDNCAVGIKANTYKMKTNLYSSLMTITALTPIIGYENAASAVKLAHKNSITLREAVIELSLMSGDEFDKRFRPEDMA